MRDVLVVIEIVWQRKLRELRQRGGNDFRRWPLPREQLGANLGEFQVRLASDDVVGQLHDGLGLNLIADFWSTQNDDEVRSQALKGGDQFGCRRHVPEVDAEPDDSRIPGEQDFRDVNRALVDVKLQDGRGALERAEVGEEIAQAERGVDVFRVEGGQNNLSHRGGQISSKQGGRQCSTLPAGRGVRI